MTDKYTLKEIEAAWRKGGKNWASMREQLTRPKPEVGLGQVVWCEDDKVYDCWPDALPPSTRQIRVLSLTEHGPAVKALRDAMEVLLARYNEHDVVLERITADALAAFDAAMGDDDE